MDINGNEPGFRLTIRAGETFSDTPRKFSFSWDSEFFWGVNGASVKNKPEGIMDLGREIWIQPWMRGLVHVACEASKNDVLGQK